MSQIKTFYVTVPFTEQVFGEATYEVKAKDESEAIQKAIEGRVVSETRRTNSGEDTEYHEDQAYAVSA